MRLGVISDTHGHVANTRAALHLLDSLAVEQLIHCGDIGSPEVVTILANWPTHYVFGNCDADLDGLRAAIAAAGGTCHERFGAETWEGRKVAWLHGDDSRLLEETTHSGEYDLVCHGHTHVAAAGQHGRTFVLNPGALYRANPHTLAIVELPELTVTTLKV